MPLPFPPLLYVGTASVVSNIQSYADHISCRYDDLSVVWAHLGSALFAHGYFRSYKVICLYVYSFVQN